MFIIISKALLFILSPFFWLILFIGFAFFSKNARRKRNAKWIAIGFFIFFTNTALFSEFCRLWEVPGTKFDKIEKHDVAIVLGGMFEYNSDLETISIRRSGDRLIQAVTLYKTKKVKKILISGDNGYLTNRGLHEAKQIKELLTKWGVNPLDIITEETSTNTHLNAQETTKLLKQSYPHFNRFILVTSGMHMKRAKACFDKEGLNCTSFSTDLHSNQTHKYQWDQYIIPNVYNFSIWSDLNKEVVGHLTYKIMGYN
tara:strand:+ start:1548 stop:2315 length:768 start_codon:yes stop_codon:yes gene_type:complete